MSRQPMKNRHWLLFVGMVLAASCSTMPSLKLIASTKFEPTQSTIAANFLAARQALYFHDVGASAEFYLTALNFDRDNASLLQQAFYTQYQLGHIDAAAAIARNMEMLNLKSSYASEPAAAKAILLQDWDAVLVLTDHIAENLNAQPFAAVIKAWALTAKGQGAAGLSHLLKIGKASTGSGQGMPSVFAMQAARLSAHLGNDSEMRGFADELFNRQNLPPQILLQLASLYARHSETGKMAQLIERLPNGFNKKTVQNQILSQTKPPKITNHIAAGIIDTSLINSQSQSGNMLNARLGLALYLDPQIDSARFLLAQALYEMEQPKAAIAKLDAIDAVGAWEQPQLLLRIDLERKDNMTGAIALLQTAVGKGGDNALLRKELGDLYRMSDQFEKARDAYLKALDLGLASGDLDRNLGISYEQLEQDHLAEARFKAALEKNPNDPYTLNYLGYWWADDGRNLEEAIKLIEQAVRLSPNSGYFVDSLGWVHYKLGNYDLAVAFLEKATMLEPMDAVITGHLGDAYWETGRYAEARFKWQYALTIATTDKLNAEFTAKLKQ
ncbi:tetratricopeptide repeat protein [Alphaproteobacteria bacterium]|nr:tetratricopeptide repeat protein [Alphaproteobacteria bacterium]